MNNILIGVLALCATIIIYYFMQKLYKKWSNPFLLPVLTSTIIIAFFLLIFDIPYQTYMVGGKWLDWLLGPAVVALAYPLYNQWNILKTYPLSILAGIILGAVIGIVSGLLLTKWLLFDDAIIYSLIPKNSTTPVAMEIASSLSGIPPLAAVFVMIAGIGGAVIGPTLLKWFKIHHYLGRGVGMGSGSHAIGITKSMENGEKEGAVSTVAMTLSAVIVSILSPICVYLLM
ncbi:LrgB family protein [Salinibacillus xinjiangensis]|uniref:LrgB family protein n=1 Tax=Salinibacillus xinjiangensis TaxID=1229268 RepID=A0A6G1X8Q8_9BACI|nr:LrgB family protein [Salinibacillus xinjiangensis]MRG87327.1 LrgB family protein [Salinibacillus xinjiangensis]